MYQNAVMYHPTDPEVGVYNDKMPVVQQQREISISKQASRKKKTKEPAVYVENRNIIHQNHNPMQQVQAANDESRLLSQEETEAKGESTEYKLKLPTPIYELGLPLNSNTSPFANFFLELQKSQPSSPTTKIRNDLTIAQLQCTESLTCADIVLESYKYNHDQIWDNMGDDNDYFTLFENWDVCILPQIFHLPALHKLHGDATFILNVQSAESWYDDIRGIGPAEYGYVPVEILIANCVAEKVTTNFVKWFNVKGETLPEQIKSLYNYTIDHVRKFAERRKTHTLVEVDARADDAGEVLFRAFYGERALEDEDVVRHIRKCWRRALATSQQDPKFSKEEEAILGVQRKNREDLLLPTPIFTVGLPKAGTTSIDNFFRCHGMHVSHNLCFPSPFKTGRMRRCGSIMHLNLQVGRGIMEHSGDYDAYTQYEEMKTLCFFPQMTHLQNIHDEYPNSTFILNMRNLDKWTNSVHRWKHTDSGFVPLDVRLTRCFHDETTIGKSTPELLKMVYEQQIDRVREFVLQHPTHHLVEVNIDEDDAPKIMQESFFGNKLGGNEPCWGKKNVNNANHVLYSTKTLVNGPKYDPVYDIIPKDVKKVYDAFRTKVEKFETKREKIKLSVPIIAVGLPVANADVIYSFFECREVRTAQKDCHSSLFGVDNPTSCARLVETNLIHSMPAFYYTGDYHCYMEIENLSTCFLPQVTHLQVLHEQYPNATFVLNTLDNPDQWFERHDSINSPKVKDLERCMKDIDVQSSISKDNLGGRMKLLYEHHLNSVKSFVKDNPSHKLVEVRVDGSNVRNELQRIFFGDDENSNDKCMKAHK